MFKRPAESSLKSSLKIIELISQNIYITIPELADQIGITTRAVNDLLPKIRGEQATFQQGKIFNPDLTNAKLKNEISLAWQDAKGQWLIYKSKLARLKDGETVIIFILQIPKK